MALTPTANGSSHCTPALLPCFCLFQLLAVTMANGSIGAPVNLALVALMGHGDVEEAISPAMVVAQANRVVNAVARGARLRSMESGAPFTDEEAAGVLAHAERVLGMQESVQAEAELAKDVVMARQRENELKAIATSATDPALAELKLRVTVAEQTLETFKLIGRMTLVGEEQERTYLLAVENALGILVHGARLLITEDPENAHEAPNGGE
jgi:hypothetical protein